LVRSSLDTRRIIRRRRNGRRRFARDGEICFGSRQASARSAPGVPASPRCGCEPGHFPIQVTGRPDAATAVGARGMLGRVARVRGFNRRNVPRLSLTEAAARRACGRSVSGALLLQPRGVCDRDHAAGSTATRATGDRCRHLTDQRARCPAARPLIWRRGNSVPHGALAMGPLP
jgi:hypothetical protein